MGVSSPKLFVAGLGNLPYPGTRHSVGHCIIDNLAARLGIKMSNTRQGYSGEGPVTIGDTELYLVLFKAKALMNISGPPIASALRSSKIDPKSMILISDSLQHKPGTLSTRLGGSPNGHNGTKSLIAALGGMSDFYRFRIGIGREGDAADYVMGKLSSFEKQYWAEEGIDKILEEIEKVAARAARA